MSFAPCTHSRQFHRVNTAGARSTLWVVVITAMTMVMEVAAGWWFNSMALLADGWHMGSHTLAIGVSSAAYLWSQRLSQDKRFAFGTWKIEVLGGFASAMLMATVAVLMVWESMGRLVAPEPIQYREAMLVTLLGLAVNLASAKLLGHAHHGHGHGHSHEHEHEHAPVKPKHGDLNLRAAYLHVLADAATSVLALVALAGAWWQGWMWLDPMMGLVGATLVAVWSWGLLRQTGAVLLDAEMDQPLVNELMHALAPQTNANWHLDDLHLWRVGENAYAAAIALSSVPEHLDAAHFRQRLSVFPEVVHATIELKHANPAAEARRTGPDQAGASRRDPSGPGAPAPATR